jgi:large subunit ribosomal protein L22
MDYKATHRHADVTARKMRPLAQLVRGRNVDEALEQLRYRPNRGARLIESVIKSAIGNAEDKGCRNIDDLVVSECRIDDGPIIKRIRPRARGTAFSIFKRLAHIRVTVSEMVYDDDIPEMDDDTTTDVVTPAEATGETTVAVAS